jgi:hypothetical protein
MIPVMAEQNIMTLLQRVGKNFEKKKPTADNAVEVA